MPFSGEEVSEKGFPGGWDADAEDQASQRVFRMTKLLEAMVFRPFAWDRFNSLNLRYAFHGGYIDSGAEWLLVPDGEVTLVDGATNRIERTDAGNVVVHQNAEFSYPELIPMAQIDARNGAFVANTYVDRRPEIGGAPIGSPGGTISFPEIIGVILNTQVPVGAVTQHQAALILTFPQLIDQILDIQVTESSVVQHEAALTILTSQLVGILPPSLISAAGVTQWCHEILKCEPFNMMLARSIGEISDDRIAASSVLQWVGEILKTPIFQMMLARSVGLVADDRISASSVTQWCAEILKCEPFDFILQRATSRRPWSSSDRCHANGALA